MPAGPVPAALAALGALAFGILIDGRSGLLISTAALAAGWFAGRLLMRHGRAQASPTRDGRTEMPREGLSDALDMAPVATILVARDTTIHFANAEARIQFPTLRTGDPLSLRLRIPEVLDAVAATLRSHAPQTAEIHERRPAERLLFARTVPLSPGRESDPAIAIFLQDASSQRRVEAMRSDFVANASHELRTPLAAILGFIETLQGPARDDAAARERFLAVMAEQARRMARLVDDLLSLSRIEMKQHIAPVERVDVREVARATIDALSGLALDKGVTVTFASGPAATVAGDRDELLRVLDNLIENAIKYGRSGGRVEVEVIDDAAQPEIAIRVRDYGPGIEPQHLPRLTERFYRVDTALSRAEGGTGLGLALVKHIVSRHRGRLDIDSRPGAGATFTVSLPRPA